MIDEPTVIEIYEDHAIVEVYYPETTHVLEIVGTGPQGPKGDAGDTIAIPETTNILIGDGLGGIDDSGIDPAAIVLKSSQAKPTTLNQVIQLLEDAGLCGSV